tara:strand:+ start:4133 stop:5026 length:894 start_codon:yes stop_codon:yes gene_type:complete
MPNPNTPEALSEVELNSLPTEKEILEYERHGWYISKKILPDTLLDNAILGVSEFYNGKRDFPFATTQSIAQSTGSEKELRNDEFVSLQKKEFQKIIFQPLISAIAAKLARTDEVRLFADSLICKYPSKVKGAIGWHTDKAYWPTCSSDNMLTAWIPLQDCTVEMGTLIHLDESNKWRDQTDFKSLLSFNDHKITNFEKFLTKHKPSAKKKLMLLKKGQVSFHNCHTIHCSQVNMSNENRLAFAIHMQDRDNSYQKAYNESGVSIKIGYDDLCAKDENGLPNYRDSTIFPILWKTNIQ